MFKFLAFKSAQLISLCFPRKAAYRLAEGLCYLKWMFSVKDKTSVKNNIAAITKSTKNLDALSLEVYKNFGRFLVDFFRMEKLTSDDFLKEYICIDGLENIKKAVIQKKGVIIITGHIGNWELGATILSKLGFPLTVVALAHKQDLLNRLFNKRRSINGNKIVQLKGAFRSLETDLREGKNVALVADRSFGSKAVAVDFFGYDAQIPVGPALLSILTGSPIVPVYMLRENVYQFRMMIDEPIFPCSNELNDQNIMELVKKYSQSIQSKIKENPGQWIMYKDYTVR